MQVLKKWSEALHSQKNNEDLITDLSYDYNYSDCYKDRPISYLLATCARKAQPLDFPRCNDSPCNIWYFINDILPGGRDIHEPYARQLSHGTRFFVDPM